MAPVKKEEEVDFNDTTLVDQRVASSDASTEPGTTDEREKTYPSDFTPSMAVIYDFLSYPENWQEVLPHQWRALYAKMPFPSTLFHQHHEPQDKLLSVMYSQELSQMDFPDQAKGAALFWDMVELGPRVRRMITHCKWLLESSTDTEEDKTLYYYQSIGKVESMISNCLEEFQAWIKSVIFIALGINIFQNLQD